METRFFSLAGFVIGATSLTVEDTIDLLLGESGFEGGQSHKYEGGYLARFKLSWLLEGEKTGDGELSTWIRQAKHN